MNRFFALLFIVLLALPAQAQTSDLEAFNKSLKDAPKLTFKQKLGGGTKLVSLEIFRFVVAMGMVEMAKCYAFNSDMKTKLEMKGPSFMANFKNPACMTQLQQMLSDPIFYAGFTAFIVANHATSSFLMKQLQRYDPTLSKGRSQFLQTQIIPSFSMAVGFMFDHVVNTLLHNPYVRACTKDFFTGKNPGMTAKLEDESLHENTGTDENGFQEKELKLNSNCEKMNLYLSSEQFLKEEMTIGLAGLLTTFGAMTVVTTGGKVMTNTAILPLLSKMPKSKLFSYYASLTAKGLGFALRGNVVGTTVMGLGHMVAFLGIFEVVNRHLIMPTYHNLWLQSIVDKKQTGLMDAYGAEIELLEEETNQQADALRAAYEKDPSVLMRDDFDDQALSKLMPKPRCSKHFAGLRGQGLDPFCTRIPLVAELMTLGDYSSTWRSKKVLGDFFMAHGSWALKLASFFNRYFGTQFQLQILSRNREIFLRNGRSDYITNIEQMTRKESLNLLGELNGFRKDVAEQRLTEIEAEIADYMTSENTEFPVGQDHPEFLVYAYLFQIYDYRFGMTLNKEGDLYNGLKLADDENPQTLWKKLREEMLEFVQLDYININNPSTHQEYLYYLSDMNLRLQENPIPGMDSMIIETMQNLELLLKSEDPKDQARAFRLWREWSPYMYGLQPRMNSENSPQFNERGMRSRQYDLYQGLNERLVNYRPHFPYDMAYLEFFAFSQEEEVGSRNQSLIGNTNEEDPLWKESMHRMETKTIGEFALVALMCSEPHTPLKGLRGIFNRWAGDRDGFSLHFPIPGARNDDLCSYLYQPLHETPFAKNASPYESVFASEEGLHFGLHQAYIQAPVDHKHPLIFDSEAESEAWWNDTVVPKSMAALATMKEEFQWMVDETFAPKIRNTVDTGLVANTGWFLKKLLGSKRDQKQEALKLVTTSDLETSFRNQLFQYRQALSQILPAAEFAPLDPAFHRLDRCIGDLLDSILSKKFSEQEEPCNQAKSELKLALESEVSANVAKYKELKDEDVLNASDPANEILQAQKQVVFDQVDALFEEIRGFQTMINEQFNFELIK